MDPQDRVENRARIAVLVDGDNARAAVLDAIMDEVGKYGSPTVRRVYGDWTGPRLQGWKDVLHAHAFQPVQQFRYVVGKNSTDAAMIIDAMDILYSQTVDGFCLVSSDSDYTRLATRLRESGKFVLGIGEKKTPKPLVRAVNKFVYTENLDDGGAKKAKGGRQQKGGRQLSKNERDEIEDLLRKAQENAAGEDGWANLGQVGEQLLELDPGFDTRTYGEQSLLKLMMSFGDMIEIRRERKSGPSPVYTRLKDWRD